MLFGWLYMSHLWTARFLKLCTSCGHPWDCWYDLHILTLVNVLFLQNRVAACKLSSGNGPWPDIMHDKYCGMGLLKLLTWTCPTGKQCSKGKPLLSCFFSSFDSGISATLYTLCSCWPQGQLFHKWCYSACFSITRIRALNHYRFS